MTIKYEITTPGREAVGRHEGYRVRVTLQPDIRAGAVNYFVYAAKFEDFGKEPAAWEKLNAEALVADGSEAAFEDGFARAEVFIDSLTKPD
jgi:hypothetical protein